MLMLSELLGLRGVTLPLGHTKLVRHRDPSYDVSRLKREGWLEVYQGLQTRGVFDHCHFVLSFLGEDAGRSRLLGLYRVQGKPRRRQIRLPEGCPYHEWIKPKSRFYTLERDERLAEFEGRLVIPWGRGSRSWHQWYRDREVLEIGPPGRVRPPFSDYLQFTLTHDELVELHQHAEANREWRLRLEAVGGVYLILATATGQQYVGSATGSGGVWARWMDYAKTGHGGNLALKTLAGTDGNYPAAFRYSLLHVFPKTSTVAEALALERICKEKLGTRALGLNLN